MTWFLEVETSKLAVLFDSFRIIGSRGVFHICEKAKVLLLSSEGNLGNPLS
jgi:hypothetical protein